VTSMFGDVSVVVFFRDYLKFWLFSDLVVRLLESWGIPEQVIDLLSGE